MEEKKKSLSFSDYKKLQNNPLISKEMLSLVRKKIEDKKSKNAFSNENSEKAFKKLDSELIAKVIKKLLQE